MQDRLDRERRTLRAMLGIYCQGQGHSRGSLCPECQNLLTYATQRLAKCPYRNDKPTCTKCPTHCYQTAMRERVRIVMRYAGPRMLVSHPILACWHFWDEVAQWRYPRSGAKGGSRPE